MIVKSFCKRFSFLSFSLCLMIVTGLVSCDNSTLKKEQVDNEFENQTAYISIGKITVAEEGRTVLPSFGEGSLDTFYFFLKGKKTSESGDLQPLSNTSGVFLDELSSTQFAVSLGEWIFELSADYNGTVFTGTVTKNIEAVAEEIDFSLKLDQEKCASSSGYLGSLSFTLNFPDPDNKVKYVTGQLYNYSSGTETTNSSYPETNLTYTAGSGTITYSLTNVSSGTYSLKIRLYANEATDESSKNQYLINTWPELVIILDAKESSATRTISSLNEVYQINWYNIEGINESLTFPQAYTRLSSDYHLPEVSKFGYDFDGWYTGANGTGTKVETIAHGSTGTQNLYANWILKSFSVNFNTGGGSTVASVSTNYGNLPPRPETDPTHTDYAFDDWYTDSDYATVYDFETMTISGTTTIYAHWVDTYAQVGGINYSTLERTCNAIKTASSTDDISVVICKAINASTELGKAATNGTIINAIKNTTAKTVALSLKDGVSITLPADCSNMFLECQQLSSFSFKGFVTSGVKSMNAMFSTCSKLATIDFEGINTSSVTDISSMFLNCSAISSLDLSSFDTSNVTLMWNVFFQCSNLESVNVSSFNTSKVTGLPGMFAYCEKLQSLDLSNFDTSLCDAFQQMFLGCEKLTTLNITSFDTSVATSITNMFDGCKELTTLDLSSFDTSNVSSASSLFNNCQKLQTIIVSNKFDLTRAKTEGLDNDLFVNCKVLTGGAGTSYIDTNPTDSTYAHIDESGNPGYFTARPNYARVGTTYCSNLTDTISAIRYATGDITVTLFGEVSADDIGQTNATNNIAIALMDTTAESVRLIVDENANITLGNSAQNMFDNCTKLISADLRGFVTTSVISMSSMFKNCINLTYLDLSSFDTSSVTNMTSMFAYDTELKTIIVTKGFVTTAAAASCENMFQQCSSIVGGEGTRFNENRTDATYARIDDPTNSKPGYFTGKPLGTKSSPDEVGDIVFSDGSAIPYTSGMTLNSVQKSNAVAVVFYAGKGLNDDGDTTTTRILGMPFEKCSEQLGWCINGAGAYNKVISTLVCSYDNNIFEGDKDGRDSLIVMQTELAAAGADDSTTQSNYPAFYAAKNYGSTTTATAGSKYENGWYLPTVAELYEVYQFWASNDSPLDSISALVKGSGTTFLGASGKTLISATQNSTAKDFVYVQFNSGSASVAATDKTEAYYYICPIIQLNQ